VLALLVLAAAVRLPVGLTDPPCVACNEDVDAVRGAVSERDWHDVLAGDVVTSEVPDADAAADRATVRVIGRVASPPARVWRVLADFEARPAWQVHTKEARIVRVDAPRVWVDERMTFFFVPIRCRILNTLDPERGTIEFALDGSEPHDIGDTRGSWLLRPFAGGTETLVVYRAWVDTGRRVPAFVQSILLRRELPKLVTELRTRVARIAAAEPGPR
jgi:uncharacterized protein YndB with AHSA1/START domain